MAGNFVDSFDNYIRENPENQNIVIPHHKSTFGNIKTETGWKKMSADRCLNRAFKSSANELYNRKEEIDNHNKQVFKSLTNKQIFSEVKQFGVNGLSGNSDEIRQIKTTFKIDKLKESEIKLKEIPTILLSILPKQLCIFLKAFE
jgi:Na+-translocating ferredoxin:NAD+ oxidoreductase RnfC subunit